MRSPPLRKTHIRVLSSAKLALHWEVKGKTEIYYGRMLGRVALAAFRGREFLIYAQRDKFGSDLALMEIADDICDIYHISGDRRLLVRYIIGTETISEVEKILQVKGIPELPTKEAFVSGKYIILEGGLTANTDADKPWSFLDLWNKKKEPEMNGKIDLNGELDEKKDEQQADEDEVESHSSCAFYEHSSTKYLLAMKYQAN